MLLENFCEELVTRTRPSTSNTPHIHQNPPTRVGALKHPIVSLFFFFIEKTMATAAGEKTAQELRKEIAELRQQQREISERLRDPRGLRRGDLGGNGPRGFGANGVGARQAGIVRQADRVDPEDQPAPKKRLSSAVVKVKDGEVIQDMTDEVQDVKQKDAVVEGDVTAAGIDGDKKSRNLPQTRGDVTRKDGNRRAVRMDFETPTMEHLPRVLPKDEDPRLVNRNRRILGQLLGTLEKFQKEDKHLSESEAFMRRSNSLQRAEQRAQEESERLRQQEREKLAENRKRDLTLRARVIAKAEEKKLELLFLEWSEHQKKLSNFLRTKAEPPIYYLPNKPLEEDAAVIEQRKEQAFLEWKNARREELSEYQKQICEQIITNAENRWQNNRNTRRENNSVMNLQETMDKELESHQLEHGPKTRKIPGAAGGNDDEDDVEDINVGEDDIIDDVLEADDNRRIDDVKPEVGNNSPSPDGMH